MHIITYVLALATFWLGVYMESERPKPKPKPVEVLVEVPAEVPEGSLCVMPKSGTLVASKVKDRVIFGIRTCDGKIYTWSRHSIVNI